MTKKSTQKKPPRSSKSMNLSKQPLESRCKSHMLFTCFWKREWALRASSRSKTGASEITLPCEAKNLAAVKPFSMQRGLQQQLLYVFLLVSFPLISS